jgi:hypothetical protein
VTFNVQAPQVESVDFSYSAADGPDFTDTRSDSGALQPAMWNASTATNGVGGPLVFAAGDNILVSPIFTIPATGGQVPMDFVGSVVDANGNVLIANDFSGSLVPTVLGGFTSNGPVTSAAPLPNLVNDTTLFIKWQVDVGGNWVNAGTTQDRMYVTAARTLIGTPFETTVQLGCDALSGTLPNQSGIVMGIWYNVFSLNNSTIMDVSGVQLTYYGNGLAVGPGKDTASLLAAGDGGCEAWTSFFLDTLAVQGVQQATDVVYVQPNAAPGVFPDDQRFRINPAIPGQGQPKPASLFGYHEFASLTVNGGTLYFDPSYGMTYGSIAQFTGNYVVGYYVQMANQPPAPVQPAPGVNPIVFQLMNYIPGVGPVK